MGHPAAGYPTHRGVRAEFSPRLGSLLLQVEGVALASEVGMEGEVLLCHAVLRGRGEEKQGGRSVLSARERRRREGVSQQVWRSREESSVVLNAKKKTKERAKASTLCSFSNNSTSAKPELVSGRSRRSMRWPR